MSSAYSNLRQEHMQRIQRQQGDLSAMKFPDFDQIYGYRNSMSNSLNKPNSDASVPEHGSSLDHTHAHASSKPSNLLCSGGKSAIKDHNPALSRNQACRTCRSRKVRCDAVKPGCGACRKTASVQGRNPDDVICEYDDESGSTRKRKQPDNMSRSLQKVDTLAALKQSNGYINGLEVKRSRTGPANKLAQHENTTGGTHNDLSHPRIATGAGWPNDRPIISGSASSSMSPPHLQLQSSASYPDVKPQSSKGSNVTIDWAAVAVASNVSAPMNGPAPNSAPFSFSYPLGDRGFLPDPNGTFSGSTLPVYRAMPLQPGRALNGDIPLHVDSGQFDYSLDTLSPVLGSTGNTRPNTSTSGKAAQKMSFTDSPELASGLPVQPSLLNGVASNAQLSSFSLGAALLPSPMQSAKPRGGMNTYSEPTPVGDPPFQAPKLQQSGIGMDLLQPSTAVQDSEFYGMFFPHWPPSLPSPRLVYQLCDVYFSKRHTTEYLINKQKFFTHLALQPSHRDFPHAALIHAMCAVATRFIKTDAFDLDKETYWRSSPSPTDYHATVAKSQVDNAIDKGEKLFSVAQAIVLICFYSYASARFVEVWLYCGLATRICSPLGLNHLESLIKETSPSNASVMPGLPEDATAFGNRQEQASHVPQTEEDKAEQAHVFWMAFTADRLATACTGWASSLAEEEVSTLLPKPDPGREPVQAATSAEMEQLSLSSPTFFTANSLPLIDAANLHYKSVILLGRVCAFLRKAPFPLGFDVIKSQRALENGAVVTLADVANSAEFKRLDALIVAFRLSFPKEFKNVLRKDPEGSVDTNLIAAHVIPHAATILLHEAFCTEADDISMQRCLTSARAILGIIYLLWGSSYDISLLQPFITFCWSVAGTLVRELAFKQEADDELGCATLSQEINVILSAMSAFADRSPLGLVVATSLRALLADPQSCHPKQNGGSLLNGEHCRPREKSRLVRTHGCNMELATAITALSTDSLSTSNDDATAPTESSALVPTPEATLSSLLFELEQPDTHLDGHKASDDKYKDAFMDLRSMLGASYDQIMGFVI